MRQMHLKNGPPLSLAQQLRGPLEPQILLSLHGLHGARMRLSYDIRIPNLI